MNLLFAYGTLLTSENPFGLYLQKHSRVVCSGKFKGLLFDIGDYPGAIYLQSASSYIVGTVVEMETNDVLKEIDNYEGFGSEHPQPNEFIRQTIEVETAFESITCWVYLYNLPITGLTQIESGNYISYLSQQA